VSDTTIVVATGNYVKLWFVPASDGKPHLARGMRERMTAS
jgi:hypothetical protein